MKKVCMNMVPKNQTEEQTLAKKPSLFQMLETQGNEHFLTL